MTLILKEILSKVFDYFKKFCKWLIKDIKNLIIVILFVFGFVSMCNTSVMRHKLHETEIALIEANDTTFEYKNKTKELYAARETYIADINELKRQNSELYKEYKNLKDHPIIIEKVETIVKMDSIRIIDSVFVTPAENMYTAKFNYNDKWCSVNGFTHFDLINYKANTDINNISFPATFTTDLIEKNNKLLFITKCDNPYVQINNIEGAVVSPTQSKVLKKHFDKPWGIMVGVGPSVGIIDNNIKVYPAFHVTIGYKLINFNL